MMLDRVTVTCAGCGRAVTRSREAQRYCSKTCRDRAADRRRRHPQEALAAMVQDPSASQRFCYSPRASHAACEAKRTPPGHGSNPDGSTRGALQGDDYPLDYFADGYPKLPDCLRRVTR
jgi:hypothetical protein